VIVWFLFRLFRYVALALLVGTALGAGHWLRAAVAMVEPVALYELISATAVNLVFVSSEYYGAFGIADNSLALMRDDSDVPHIFVGYDGHVFLSTANALGFITLQWHRLKLKEADVQVLPKLLQKYPERYTRIEKVLFLMTFGLKEPRRFFQRLQHRLRRQPPASSS
jgi:hypothetical protein